MTSSEKPILFIENKKEFINFDDDENIIYIGDVIKKNTLSRGKWMIEYKCDTSIQKKENGRIYLIVVDGFIYKIGSSESKGGIKNTFGSYAGGLGGSPSLRTFGIHLLIQEQLDAGKKIQIYALFIEPVLVVVRGLLSSVEKITFPQIKEMEDLCREDYKKYHHKYPRWNFQENGEKWYDYIQLAYREQVNNR
jgi:hypothetical protein